MRTASPPPSRSSVPEGSITKPIIRILLSAFALAGLPIASAGAQAVSAESQADGRCMAAFVALSEKAAAADKAGLDASMMYFMGKIVGRAGKAALTTAIGAGAATVTDVTAAGIAEKCAAEIEAASDAM